MNLGKLPARPDDRTLTFRPPAGYVPPAARAWSSSVTNLGPMLNLGYKCCTVAAAGHLLQAWTAARGSQWVMPDPVVYAEYKAISGCDPQGAPPTDTGAFALDVLERWRKVGLGGHQIRRYGLVPSRDRRAVMAAIDLCGGAFVGLNLPQSAEQQPDWRVRIGDTTGTWRGHMIAALDYDADGLTCVTWGRLQRMTWRYWDAYSDETWAIVDADDLPDDPRRSAIVLA